MIAKVTARRMRNLENYGPQDMSVSQNSPVFFDHKEKVIRGPGFTVKHRGLDPVEPRCDIFIYEDASVRFRFDAQRFVRDKDGLWSDSQAYDVVAIGAIDFFTPNLALEKDITPLQRKFALENIEKALYFDESPWHDQPVKEVRVSVKR